MKTSPAFGRRRFHQKTRTILFVPHPVSFFAVLFLFVLCCFLSFFCSSFLLPGSPSAPPTSMVLDSLWKIKGEKGPKNGRNSLWCKNIEKMGGPKNVQNSIRGKTGHLKICQPVLGECWTAMIDCKFHIFTSTNSLHQHHLLVGSENCTCSQFPTETMHWIKEMEMVESVDDLKSSRSIGKTHWPDWAARRENCVSTEQNHPEYQIHEKNQSGEKKKPRSRTISFVISRTWSTSAFKSSEPTILSRIMATYQQPSRSFPPTKYNEWSPSKNQMRSSCLTSKICMCNSWDVNVLQRVISWFNINPLSFIHRNDAWWTINKFSSLRFCFCLWSACKILCLQL